MGCAETYTLKPMTTPTKNNTCVYIHTRSDGVVFYVGIGSPSRPYSEYRRNKHWHNTTEKHGYTVNILYENLSLDAACALEIGLIAKYRTISGSKLCNMTAGGEGTKGITPSEETRKKLRAAYTGHSNFLGKTHSGEALAKMSAAHKGNTAFLGKTHSEETRAKMRAAHKKRAEQMV